MIPVRRQPEPPDFDAKVRAKGMRALAQHKPRPPVPATFWVKKEHWRHALDDLMVAYRCTCAFAAIRIERTTGSRTVEHFKPKTRHPRLAYEWDNFRLACSRMNGRKGDHEDVLDPFEIPDDTFDLDPTSGVILIHPMCPAGLQAAARTTIDRLRLNHTDLCADRKEHCTKIIGGDWSLAEGKDHSPFVYSCLEKQGLIRSASPVIRAPRPRSRR